MRIPFPPQDMHYSFKADYDQKDAEGKKKRGKLF